MRARVCLAGAAGLFVAAAAIVACGSDGSSGGAPGESDGGDGSTPRTDGGGSLSGDGGGGGGDGGTSGDATTGDGDGSTSGDGGLLSDGSVADAAIDAGPGSASFHLAPIGCAMAHCDPALDDAIGIAAPSSSTVVAAAHDTSVFGVNAGLGCAGNGTVTACSLAGDANPHLVLYAADGTHKWDSTSDLDSTASASAPMVSDQGEVIAADDAHVVRYNADGSKKWIVGTAGGTPISPSLVDRYVVTATKAATGTASAPISSYDVDTGVATSTLTIPAPNGGGYSATNSPGAYGNRFYITTSLITANGLADSSDEGELFAIDDTAGKLSVAWMFTFHGTSGASPLVLLSPTTGKPRVYFDGDGQADASTNNFVFFCIEDEGASFEQVWSHGIPAQAEANAAHDPRAGGGLWTFGAGDTVLSLLDENTGALKQSIDVSTFISGAGPSSAMSIAFDGTGDPVMIVAAASKEMLATNQQHMLAIDLVSATAVWDYEIGKPTLAQFPLAVNSSGKPVVFVPTVDNGILLLASP